MSNVSRRNERSALSEEMAVMISPEYKQETKSIRRSQAR
ncbi:hypothetical protein BN133_1812 [Cronobacter dublinensis 582]|nr:hypothetical protein BN133_1812 [Cronobacter dublinensis 582]